MSLVAFLDRQHAGKPSVAKVGDRGARHDLDGSGSIDTDEMEAMLTGYMGLAAEGRLLELGHHAIPLSDGWYADRHGRVNAMSSRFPGWLRAYVALHLNSAAVPPTYGAVFYWPGSSQGRLLATCIADQLRERCPELPRVIVDAADPDRWPGPHATIKGVGRPVAICYEPAPLNLPAAAPLFEMQGLRRMGECLATGLHHWALSR